MTYRHLAWTVAALMGVVAGPVQAQQTTFGGQVRPRFEFRDVGGESGQSAFTSMRVRAQLDAALEGRVRVFVQLQDVRLWGEEQNTLGDFNADNFDLHQGFIQVGLGDDGWFTGRVGRQEINLGDQRLVGAVGWTQQGRSFDGARVRALKDWGTLELLGTVIAEEDASGIDDEATFFGGYAVIDLPEDDALDLYAFNQHVSGVLDDHTSQSSLGARFHGARSGLTYRGEATLQFGERAGSDVSAYMFGARVGKAVRDGRSTVTLWLDYLSGDDDPTDGQIKVFDTMFATNHKFYGFADLFLNIPVHTGGLGLTDLAIKSSHNIGGSSSLGVDVHSLRSSAEGALSSRSFANEIDFTFTHRHTDNLSLVAGLSQVFMGDALMELGRFAADQQFVYVMLNGVF